MKNYKITVSYDGTRYNGWQRQGNTKNTLQEKFETVLSRMCGRPVEIFASGRTDAGVHALAQVASFKCETELSLKEILYYLNHYLPEDIAVTDICEVDMRFHARLSAKRKTYTYTLATDKQNVFLRKYIYLPETVPNIEKMREAAAMLIGKHDFKSFSSVKTKKSTVREIYAIDIKEENSLIKITVTGSGFLHNMVRIIVGTLYEIGIGKKEISVIPMLLQTDNRSLAGMTMPARGLMLTEVSYM